MQSANTAANPTAAPQTAADPQAPASQASQAAPQAAQRDPYAAARRQAEAEKKREISALTARQEAFALSRGYASFDEMERANHAEQLQTGNVDAVLGPMVNQALESRLEQHPVLRMAREQMQRAVVDQSVQEFRQAFPKAGVQTVADLLRVPNFDEFSRLVGMGLTYVQAYKLANEGELQAQGVAAARQATLNRLNGKGHMTGTEAAADDPDTDVTVPDETLRGYRAVMPGWSDAQIRRHYKKSHAQ